MEALQAEEEFLPSFQFTPEIAGAFTGWHYKEMRDIIPFCMDNDPIPLDFEELCIKERKIKAE